MCCSTLYWYAWESLFWSIVNEEAVIASHGRFHVMAESVSCLFLSPYVFHCFSLVVDGKWCNRLELFKLYAHHRVLLTFRDHYSFEKETRRRKRQQERQREKDFTWMIEGCGGVMPVRMSGLMSVHEIKQ